MVEKEKGKALKACLAHKQERVSNEEQEGPWLSKAGKLLRLTLAKQPYSQQFSVRSPSWFLETKGNMVGRSNQVYRVDAQRGGNKEAHQGPGSEKWEPAAVVQRMTLKLREGLERT